LNSPTADLEGDADPLERLQRHRLVQDRGREADGGRRLGPYILVLNTADGGQKWVKSGIELTHGRPHLSVVAKDNCQNQDHTALVILLLPKGIEGDADPLERLQRHRLVSDAKVPGNGTLPPEFIIKAPASTDIWAKPPSTIGGIQNQDHTALVILLLPKGIEGDADPLERLQRTHPRQTPPQRRRQR
jgi:hypothetical protein